MEHGERHIRRLRLAGSDTLSLPAARHQLEEAFRLASLPGLPPSALVLIRKLDLGRIRADAPPWRLAERIDDLVRELSGQAVCVDRQAAPAASVVWFSDPLRPFMALMTRLLDNGAATEWYWRGVFPGKGFFLDGSTIEGLLRGAGETPIGGLGQGLLVQHGLSSPGRGRFFSFLTRPMIIRLFHALGLPVVGLDRQKSPGAGRQGYTLSAAAGQADPLPHGKEAIRAPELSSPWRSALQWAACNWGAGDERSLWLAYHGLFCHQPSYLSRSGIPQRIVLADWLAQWAAGGSEGNGDAGSTADGGQSVATARRQSSAMMKPAFVLAEGTHGEVVEPVERLSLAFNGVSGLSKSPAGEEKGGRDDQGPEKLSARPAVSMPETQSRFSPAAARQEYGPPFSPHAGFALLIPLLARLGMAELLAGNELLVEHDFPRRVLSAFARRFGLAADDPCRVLFDRPVSAGNPVITEFCAPPPWWRLAGEGRRSLICRRAVDGDHRVIAAPSGRWLLGVGDVEKMAAAGGLNSAIPATDRGMERPLRLDDVLVSMQLAASVYLRRCCAISFRTLLGRPGKVMLSATHWDVVFDLNQTDLRLRRAALDSDPGWVAWLGKVVRFYYQENTERIFNPSNRAQR